MVEMIKQEIWKEELWLKHGVKLEVEKFHVVLSECDYGVEWRKRIWKMKIFVIHING